MLLSQTLILERHDLLNNEINTDIRILNLNCFNIATSILINYDIILFLDKDGQCIFLKNRFGNI